MTEQCSTYYCEWLSKSTFLVISNTLHNVCILYLICLRNSCSADWFSSGFILALNFLLLTPPFPSPTPPSPALNLWDMRLTSQHTVCSLTLPTLVYGRYREKGGRTHVVMGKGGREETITDWPLTLPVSWQLAHESFIQYLANKPGKGTILQTPFINKNCA